MTSAEATRTATRPKSVGEQCFSYPCALVGGIDEFGIFESTFAPVPFVSEITKHIRQGEGRGGERVLRGDRRDGALRNWRGMGGADSY